jgi:chromosome segregation ATPase
MATVKEQVSLEQQRAGALERLNAKASEQHQFEIAFQQARSWLAEAQSRREGFVRELATAADAATVGFLEDSVDECDREVLSHQRFIESHTIRLAEISAAHESLSCEYNRLDEEVKAAEKAAAFEAGKAQLTKLFSDADSRLHEIRLILGELVQLAYRFNEEFGAPASQFLTVTAERFFASQNGLGNRGITPVHGWNTPQFEFLLRPYRKESK